MLNAHRGRPLRLKFAAAVYHVTSCGDRREDIYWNGDDHRAWLAVLSLVCERFKWIVHTWCQMSNQYHIFIKPPDGSLPAGMRQLNGLHTRALTAAIPSMATFSRADLTQFWPKKRHIYWNWRAMWYSIRFVHGWWNCRNSGYIRQNQRT